LFFILSCTPSSKEDTALSLAALVANQTIEIDAVIACASGSVNDNEVVVYVYPRPESLQIKYFETQSTSVNKNDYANYTQIELPEEDFFNGYLKSFRRFTEEERWVIITFMENGVLHLSNPIRLKHKTQNTLFTDSVLISNSQENMPVFNWKELINPLDAIYFQVVSDNQNELLSGTYTFDTYFKYYNLDNVVLNITEETPPPLFQGQIYCFTMMGVSEDNWVNTFLKTSFQLKE